jgi:hypothetical protein
LPADEGASVVGKTVLSSVFTALATWGAPSIVEATPVEEEGARLTANPEYDTGTIMAPNIIIKHVNTPKRDRLPCIVSALHTR